MTPRASARPGRLGPRTEAGLLLEKKIWEVAQETAKNGVCTTGGMIHLEGKTR